MVNQDRLHKRINVSAVMQCYSKYLHAVVGTKHAVPGCSRCVVVTPLPDKHLQKLATRFSSLICSVKELTVRIHNITKCKQRSGDVQLTVT